MSKKKKKGVFFRREPLTYTYNTIICGPSVIWIWYQWRIRLQLCIWVWTKTVSPVGPWICGGSITVRVGNRKWSVIQRQVEIHWKYVYIFFRGYFIVLSVITEVFVRTGSTVHSITYSISDVVAPISWYYTIVFICSYSVGDSFLIFCHSCYSTVAYVLYDES